MRNRIYLRPELYDLSQGTRIKFVRIFRHLTQDNISDDLGITGENKRRTLTRYEKEIEIQVNLDYRNYLRYF